MSAAKPHLCFVVPNLYPVLAGSKDIPVVGGSEFRSSILARAFVAAGHRVTAITMDFGQGKDTEVDGVRVIATHRPQAGVPVLRWAHPQLTSFARAMGQADADIYYQQNASPLTALTAWHAARTGRCSVYSGASDTDFMRGQERIRFARDRWLFRRGLERVDAIVAQSTRQAELVRRHYGRDTTVIPSPYAAPPRVLAQRDDLVLWVGGIRRVKRPDRFIALALAMPEYRFRMIGGPMGANPGAREYYKAIRAEARGVRNLEFLGFLPVAEVEPHFDEARLLVNTSEHEGFPNTFLQAWARGIPVVSFFDAGQRPDGSRVFERVGSEAEAKAAIGRLMSDAVGWEALSCACAAHFRATHAVERVVERFGALFARLGFGESTGDSQSLR